MYRPRQVGLLLACAGVLGLPTLPIAGVAHSAVASDSATDSAADRPTANVADGAVDNAASVEGKTLRWMQLLAERELITFEPRQLRRQLTRHFLQVGVERVTESGVLLVRNQDYGIDYSRGVLFLLQPIQSRRVLEIHYGYLPGPGQRRFNAAQVLSRDEAFALAAGAAATAASGNAVGAAGVASAASATTSLAGASGEPGVRPPPGSGGSMQLPQGLQLIGSKTIGVTFGQNREASLEQSLRVQVSGQLSDDLRVDAVLSDDNLPVLPNGDTEELGDLNRVFVSIQGPVVGGVVGDFELRQEKGEFVRFDRALRGGGAHVQLGKQRLSASAGLAKGELLNVSFRGVEGKQGPYEMLSSRRLVLSVIIPGSERVYMDGRQLQRGANHDYIIDYARGELRFSSRRRVTADSEIDIEFQVTSQSYRRDTRSARLESRAGSWQLDAFLVQEGDQADRPVGLALSPDEIAILEQAGDEAAIAPGIRNVSEGAGRYRYGDLDSTFVVYDPDTGNLRVDFYEIGFGQGSYEDSLDVLTGLRFFQHVGAGLGAFEIGKLLTPPSRTRVATGLLSGAPWQGASLVAEASLSDFDGNLFSQGNDADNQGEAVDLRFDTGQGSLGGLGRAGIAMHVSQLSPVFRSLGTQRRAFYYKEWNAEQDSLKNTERLAEATLRWASSEQKPWLKLDANFGRLDRQAALQTDRTQVDAELGRTRQRGGEFRWQGLDTVRPELGADGDRQRQFIRGAMRYQLGGLLPEIRFEQDEFTRSAIDSFIRPSYRYADLRYRLGLGRGKTRATLEFGRRDTDTRRSSQEQAEGLREWAPERRNDHILVELLSHPSRSWNTELAWSRRTNQPLSETSTAAETRSDLGRMVLRFRPPKGFARGELRYEISDEEARQLEQILVLSPDGKGDYDAEGRAVGKDQGLYDKISRFLGGSIPVRQLQASMRLDLGGGATARADSNRGWFRRNVSVTQVLSVQEQTSADSRDLYLLQPAAFQNANTVFGVFRARQEWSLLNSKKVSSLRLFLNWENNHDARSGGAPVKSSRREARASYEHTSSRRITLGGELAASQRRRLGALDANVPGRPSSDSYDVQQQRVATSLTYRISSNERLLLELNASQQDDALSGTQQRALSARPSMALAPVRNLRILASGSLTRVFEDKPLGVLPPFFFDPPGNRLQSSFTGSYRLGRNLNFNITYTGVRHTDGRTTYDVKAETRAIF